MKHKKGLAHWALLPLAALALALGALLWEHLFGELGAQSAQALREAVLRGAVQCYAVEGVYPESVDYLEQAYGLLIDHDRFLVDYQIYAENQLPEVQVWQK